MSNWFDAWGPWAWVVFAWAQLFITYGGLQLYLWRRVKKLEETPSNG